MGIFADDWYTIQVEQVDKVGRPDFDQFEALWNQRMLPCLRPISPLRKPVPPHREPVLALCKTA